MNKIRVDKPDKDRGNRRVPANGVDGTTGQYFEEITLSPMSFGNWTLQTIPDELIRQELGKQIAKMIEYDTKIVLDPETQRPMVKNSTVVYMKPDNVELFKENKSLHQTLKDERKKHNEEILKVDDERREMIVECDQIYDALTKYSDLFDMMNANDNSWKYHFRKIPPLMWYDFKIFLIKVLSVFPFR